MLSVDQVLQRVAIEVQVCIDPDSSLKRNCALLGSRLHLSHYVLKDILRHQSIVFDPLFCEQLMWIVVLTRTAIGCQDVS